MFENLSSSINKAIKNLKGHGKITDLNISKTLKEIRRALVNADVNYKIAKELTEKIKHKALGQNVLISVSPGQLLTKIVNDELTELMGSTSTDINLVGNPAIIMLVGLQGSGKTTFAGKLANKLKNEGKNTLLAACDVHRPAAINQLKTLGEQIGVEVYSEAENKNPINIAENAIKYAKENKNKVVIIDTAGRLAIDEKLMEEVKVLKNKLNPSETLFIVDSMTGQDAVNTAKTFNDKLDYDGVVLTKLDGDARGGSAITIKYVVDKPIKFISTGEKLIDLSIFYPDRMASRILGMGDVISVVERAQQVYDEEEARRISKKIKKNKFDYNDFLTQTRQLKKMGNIKEMISLIPGLSSQIKNIDFDEDSLKPYEIMIASMTPKERANPDLMNQNRKIRISKGSGLPINIVHSQVKQFEEMRALMKKTSKGGLKNFMNQFKSNQFPT